MALLPSIPTLTTARLILRELRDNDAEAIYRCYRDPEMYELSDWRADSPKSGLGFINYYRRSFNDSEALRWGICLKGADTVIGTIGFQNIHWKQRVEFGYDVAKAYWNRGIASEAIPPVLAFGFAKLNFVRIEAWVHPQNAASRHLLKKFGFTEEGLLRKYAYVMYAGTWIDVYFYSLLKDEFQKDRKPA